VKENLRNIWNKLARREVLEAGLITLILVLLMVPTTYTIKAMEMEMEDYDGDGLLNYMEMELGTDDYLADTDGDGMGDGEEVFDFDSDPTVHELSVFPEGETVKLLTPMPEVEVRAMNLFVKGVTALDKEEVQVSLVNEHFYHEDKARVDEHGVFAKLVDLTSLCADGASKQMQLFVERTLMMTLTLACEVTPAEDYVKNATFAGQDILSILHTTPTILLSSMEEARFEGYVPYQQELYASYSSNVFSTGVFADHEYDFVAVSPHKYLEEGRHHFYLVICDKRTRTLFEPIVITFDLIYPPKTGILQAMLQYSVLGLFTAISIGLAGGLYTRHLKEEIEENQ